MNSKALVMYECMLGKGMEVLGLELHRVVMGTDPGLTTKNLLRLRVTNYASRGLCFKNSSLNNPT